MHSSLVSPSSRIRGAAQVACALAAVLAASSARADGAACDAVFAAMAKMAGTPNHQFITTTRGGGKTTQGEVVTVDNKRWVLAVGHWQHSRPYDAATESRDLLAARTGKQSCTHGRSEAINGDSATIFSVHNPTEDGTSDSQTWISTSRGLPLRQVIDISEGKTHIEVRIDYAHVTTPAAS